MDDWAIRDFKRIIKYCESADAFQDVPFSLDFTYEILDYAFPGSKFILTVRNNADEWYRSLVRFHSKIMDVSGLPTAKDLKNFSYRSQGWLWRFSQYVYGVDELTIYDEKKYKEYYTNHNCQVMVYFKFRKEDLLVLNLSDLLSMESLCIFLGIPYTGQVMPQLRGQVRNVAESKNPYKKKDVPAILMPSTASIQPAPENFHVLAIMATYNDEDIILPILSHLVSDQISVYVIDNWSTDRTWERLLSFVKRLILAGISDSRLQHRRITFGRKY